MAEKSGDSTERLRGDTEAGLRFLHTFAMQSKIDLIELMTRLGALVEELVDKGVVDPSSLELKLLKTRHAENERMTRQAHVQVELAPPRDKYKMADLPEIDCAARLHLCKARCCSFQFPLSVQDLDERVVEWDYARPYRIRRRPDGYCVHNEAGGCACAVYANRPAICRGYDCRQDRRVWVDFDKRIPAEWPGGER